MSTSYLNEHFILGKICDAVQHEWIRGGTVPGTPYVIFGAGYGVPGTIVNQG
jgi:hypothetical protein